MFISYAQEERPQADHLAMQLHGLGHEPWTDSTLLAGQAWWNVILERIRAVDAVLLVVSPSFLASQACTLERQYAARLGKHLLPVMVSLVPHHILPGELAPLQFVDYTQPGETAAYAFAKALATIRPANPLPNPLPPPPPVPLSYLSGLRDRLAQPTLTMNEQLEIAEMLVRGAHADDTEERRAALELLGMLRRRPDLFEVTSRRIQEELSHERIQVSSQPTWAPQVNAPTARPAPVSTGIPRFVQVLAWIGAIFIALVILAWLMTPDSACGYDSAGFWHCV